MKSRTLLAAGSAILAQARPLLGIIEVYDDRPPSPYEQIKTSQSAVFGWQIAGAALNDDSLNEICENVNGAGYINWLEDGLLPNVGNVVCNATNYPISNQTAYPMVVNASTEAFNTQVLNAFGAANSSVFETLCSGIDEDQLSAFGLSDDYLSDSICAAAGTHRAPTPFASFGPQVNYTAVNVATNSSSYMFAVLYATAASSQSELSQWCARAPASITAWNNMALNGQLIHDTLCSFTEEVPCAEEGQVAIVQFSTDTFVAIMQAAFSAGNDWLCKNLDVEAMNSIGLDGSCISERVCA